MEEKYCGACGRKLRPDVCFCTFCGQSVPTMATTTSSQGDDSAPSPSPRLTKDMATSSAEQNEDTELKEWWQTKLGRAVGALTILATILILTGSLVGYPWVWVRGVGYLLLLTAPILGVGAVVLRKIGSAAGWTTGHDYNEPISDQASGPSPEDAAEISKLCFEYFKHFTTITTAAALVELALYQQLALNTASTVMGVCTLGLTLLLCIVGLVLLSVGTTTKGGFIRIGRLFRGLMISIAFLFLFGIAIFALAALFPAFNQFFNQLNHWLYEIAKAMAQDIR